MERWFASDWHLNHENIIRYSNRPFSDAKIMNEFILDAHNSLVKPQDHYSNLGDLTMDRGGRVQQEAFIKLIRKFNGHGRLFLGNHDHFPIETYLAAGFEKIYATWRDQQGLLFSHMPLHPTSIGSAVANIHGHIHQNNSPSPATWVDKSGKTWVKPYINICVEKTNYRPIHYDEILEMVRIEKEKYED